MKRKPRRWKVVVSVIGLRSRVNSARYKAIAEKVLGDLDDRKIPKEVSELSLVFTSDSRIKKLNSKYRKKNKATDVLSFSQLDGENDHFGPILGDVVISLETAKRQAKEFKVTLNDELNRLIVHGILHLFGYDHEGVSRKEAEKMFRLQDRVVSEVKEQFD